MFLESILEGYESALRFIAELTVFTLELIGISIIIFGSIRAIMQAITHLRKKDDKSVMIVLGRALALALEFKMGAEIVNTVIIHELSELVNLAVVIALRTVLAILIHWEITNERKAKKEESERADSKSSN